MSACRNQRPPSGKGDPTKAKGGAAKLILALDFGTTFSGVAYAFDSQGSSIYSVQDWPGAQGRTSPKAPTLIRYDGLDIKWGFDVDRTVKGFIEAIKLRLDPDQPQPLFVPAVDTNAQLKKSGFSAEQVATDYIRAIFKHSMEQIEQKYPSGYIDTLEKSFVLTVPAIWSEKAMNATMRAAATAGITPVTLIKEPEAAALFTLRQMSDKDLQVGDAFVLCDAGGGTVDLISYEIISLDPFELKELTNSSGSMAGSLLLNRRFDEWIKEVTGEKTYVKLQGTDAYCRALKSFEEDIKPGFTSIGDRDEYVTFPKANLADNVGQGLVHNTLTVTGKVLHSIFEPIIREIIKLIEIQVMGVRMRRMKDRHRDAYNIKAIFLVGGFGSNKHLYERVRAANEDIQVIQPNDAWSAIVRGAVMSQLPTEVRVTINCAEKHYGVPVHSRHDAVRDIGRKKDWDEYDECWRVSTMNWFINKGDDLARSRQIEFSFVRRFRSFPTTAQLLVSNTLYQSDLDRAPTHPDYGNMIKHIVLRSDLSLVPKSEIRKKSRREYYGTSEFQWWEIDYRLSITVGSGPMIFSLICNGQECGRVAAEY